MKSKHLSIISFIGLIVSCAGGTARQVSLANDIVMNYWDNYEPTMTMDLRIEGEEQYYPKPFRYDFEQKDGVINREVSVSTNKNMQNAAKYTTNGAFIDIENLYMNTNYYVRVDEATGDKTTKGKVEKIHTAEYPRTLKVEGVSNTRDLGGYKTTNGKRVAQGKVYRGANVDGVRPEGLETMVDKLGIKTDLDLRGIGEGTAGTVSPLGINYVNVSGAMYLYGEMGLINYSGEEAFKNEILTFTNPDNYPIYFHCAVGRDRTGTLGMVLLALLGVDSDTILKEYELSFLSTSGNSGMPNVFNMLAYAEETLGYIVMAGQENPKDSLAKCTENWLIDYIGITKDDINAIKKELLTK